MPSPLPDVRWQRAAVGDEPVVLLLPGGTADSDLPADEESFGRRRLRRYVDPLLAGLPDVALGTVAYRVRGWNGPAADPARDVRAVLDALPGRSPVVLVGHSMGGRAGLACADHPRVRGVVGLAPWTPVGEPVEAVRGKTVVLAHGTWDRWVHTDLSLRWAERAEGVAGRLARFVVRRDEHMMLLRPGRWHAFAVAGVRAVLGRGVDPVLDAAFDAGARGRLDVPLPALTA
ncbi:alpha/beta hydrolase [Rhodococcus aerolatus]